MIGLEYWDGEEWVIAGGPFYNEEMAWVSLGGDDVNYRTVTFPPGGKVVLTDKREEVEDVPGVHKAGHHSIG